MGKAISSVGKAVGGLAGTALGAIGGNALAGAVGGTKPAPGLRRIGTGRSSFERTGSNNNALDVSLDPRINAGQESFLSNVRGLRDQVNPAFNLAQGELAGIRDEVGGLKDFFAQDGDFTDTVLNPVREGVARRRGELTTELGRTDVRGSFKNQQLNAFGRDSDRALSDATASAENQRIASLSSLLDMDATLLQRSLQNDVGRTNLLMGLEESLRGVSTERFNMEMQKLGLGTGIGQTPLDQQQQMNQQGIFSGEVTSAIGGILGGFAGGPAGAIAGQAAMDSRTGFGVGSIFTGNGAR